MAVFLGAFSDGRTEDGAYPTMETDGINTATSQQQMDCEKICDLSFLPLRPGALDEEDLKEFLEEGIINTEGEAVLMRKKHKAYLELGLSGLGPGFISLDASRPWMVYWILHSLDLLDGFPQGDTPRNIVETIVSCQDPINGGFGGGPKQLSHCAPTYASVLSLLIIGTPEAYAAIDRKNLYRFFVSLKHASGGFRIHDDGEVDVRGTYTVIAVSSLLNMLTPELAEGVADFAVRCQTYEGGFGGEPWNEAHGGYTFCAFAALVILNGCDRADLDSLRRWLCGRQMRGEGGFQGRTNKLVDGCYSFWQGGALALLDFIAQGRQTEASCRDAKGRFVPPRRSQNLVDTGGGSGDTIPSPSIGVSTEAAGKGSVGFCRERLQEYVLMCSQQSNGGLRDKPGKLRDFYHTCYTLSGLSVAQHCLTADKPVIVGNLSNLLRPTNPVFNIAEDKVARAMSYFEALPSDHVFLMDESVTPP